MKHTKKGLILTSVVGLACCVVSTAELPSNRINLNLRGRRLDTNEDYGVVEQEVLCIDLGDGGQQTFVVPEIISDLFTERTIRGFIPTTRGACRQDRAENLSERQQAMKRYCFDLGRDTFRLYAPRAARKLLSRLGIHRGGCRDRITRPTEEMKLKSVPIEDEAATDTIIGHDWQAIELYRESTGKLEEVKASGRTGKTASIMFDSEDKAHGSGGCNHCWGNVSLFTSNSFGMPALACTRMYCADTMDQERDFLKVISGHINCYELDQGQLILYETDEDDSCSGKKLAVFVKESEEMI